MFDPVHLFKQLCGCHEPTNLANGDAGQPPNAVEEEAPVLDTTTLPTRYRAYGILYCAVIPLCIWFEDALAHFGVPTFTFALFLVVPSAQLAQAINHLEKAGYKKRRPHLDYRNIRQFENMYEPEKPSIAADSATVAENGGDGFPPTNPADIIDSSNPPVVLLSADEWFYKLPQITAGMQDCFPTLPQYLTSIVSKWLSAAENEVMLRMHLAVQLEYIYEYLDEVKQPGFEKNLPSYLREFHLDGVNATGSRELSLVENQRKYRQQISEVHGGNADAEWVLGAEQSSQ